MERYQKTDWVDGQIILEEDLDKIEGQLELLTDKDIVLEDSFSIFQARAETDIEDLKILKQDKHFGIIYASSQITIFSNFTYESSLGLQCNVSNNIVTLTLIPGVNGTPASMDTANQKVINITLPDNLNTGTLTVFETGTCELSHDGETETFKIDPIKLFDNIQYDLIQIRLSGATPILYRYVYDNTQKKLKKLEEDITNLDTNIVTNTENINALRNQKASMIEKAMASNKILSITNPDINTPLQIGLNIPIQQDKYNYNKVWAGKNNINLCPPHFSFLDSYALDSHADSFYNIVNNGIRFQVFADGHIIVNGTASSTFSTLNITTILSNNKSSYYLPAGSYTVRLGMSQSQSGVSLNLAGTNFNLSTNGTAPSTYRLTTGDNISITINITPNTTCTNLSLYPMIVQGSYTTESSFPEYTPYENLGQIKSHTNIYCAHTGMNLLPSNIWEDGSLTSNGIATDNEYSIRTSDFSIITESQSYVFSTNDIVASSIIVFYNKTKNMIKQTVLWEENSDTQSIVFSAPTDAAYYKMVLSNDDSQPSKESEYWITRGNIQQSYSAYNGEYYNFTIPTEAGSVYHGQIQCKRDGSKQLIVDYATIILDDTTAWSAVPNITGTYYVSGKTADAYTNQDESNFAYCNSYIQRPYTKRLSLQVGEFALGSSIYIKTLPYASVTEFKQSLAKRPIQIVYKLAESLVYDLSDNSNPLIPYDETNIIQSIGPITARYALDMQKYTDTNIQESQQQTLITIDASVDQKLQNQWNNINDVIDNKIAAQDEIAANREQTLINNALTIQHKGPYPVSSFVWLENDTFSNLGYNYAYTIFSSIQGKKECIFHPIQVEGNITLGTINSVLAPFVTSHQSGVGTSYRIYSKTNDYQITEYSGCFINFNS